MSLNFAFLIVLNIDVLSNHTIVSVVWVRSIGALGCWFMWIKLFYWMRLFRSTAYFITLISQTIFDVRIFSMMLAIILCAFANFFFVLNNNTVESDGFHYVGSYVGNTVADAFIAMYLMGLGEFDMDGYSQGTNVYMTWGFFLMGTFLVLVVFMNMLIAIMGDTFGNVQAIQEESAL